MTEGEIRFNFTAEEEVAAARALGVTSFASQNDGLNQGEQSPQQTPASITGEKVRYIDGRRYLVRDAAHVKLFNEYNAEAERNRKWQNSQVQPDRDANKH